MAYGSQYGGLYGAEAGGDASVVLSGVHATVVVGVLAASASVSVALPAVDSTGAASGPTVLVAFSTVLESVESQGTADVLSAVGDLDAVLPRGLWIGLNALAGALLEAVQAAPAADIELGQTGTVHLAKYWRRPRKVTGSVRLFGVESDGLVGTCTAVGEVHVAGSAKATSRVSVAKVGSVRVHGIRNPTLEEELFFLLEAA